MECLIVGGGAAGLNAAITFRRCWPQKPVMLIEAERETGYYRTLLPQFMSGCMEEERLFFWRAGDDPLFTVISGINARSLDRANQCLNLGNGEKIHYKRLVLAPGGRPLIPGICSADICRGIFPVRNLAVARKVREWLSARQEIVVLGGGLVGVKTAIFLRISGFNVSLIEKEDHVLPQVLTPEASGLIEKHLCQMGIKMFLGSVLNDVQIEKKSINAVIVDEKRMSCDTLLIAIGSKPDVDFLKGSGLLEKGELVVSSSLQTKDAKIFAAGDAVTICDSDGKKFKPWTWPQAVTQGKLVGANLYRSTPISLNTLTRPNSINLHGLSMVILGAPVQGVEIVKYSKPGENIHRELFISDNRIVGGALVGEISGAGPLHSAMVNGKEMDNYLYELLRPCSRVISRFVGNFSGQRPQALFLSNQEF